MRLNFTVEWRDDETWQLIAPPSRVKIKYTLNFINNSFSEMQITYNDIENDEGGALLFHWIAEQYRVVSTQPQNWSSERSTVVLRAHDENNEVFETWYLENALISAVDWGYLDSTPDEVDFNVTIKFSTVNYSSNQKMISTLQEQQ